MINWLKDLNLPKHVECKLLRGIVSKYAHNTRSLFRETSGIFYFDLQIKLISVARLKLNVV